MKTTTLLFLALTTVSVHAGTPMTTKSFAIGPSVALLCDKGTESVERVDATGPSDAPVAPKTPSSDEMARPKSKSSKAPLPSRAHLWLT